MTKATENRLFKLINSVFIGALVLAIAVGLEESLSRGIEVVDLQVIVGLFALLGFTVWARTFDIRPAEPADYERTRARRGRG